MNKSDLSRETLAKIKKNEIKPEPKWHFLLKRSLLLTLFGVTVCLGGLAVSVVIFVLAINDWDIAAQFPGGRLNFMAQSLPYFWLLLFVLFSLIAYYNLRHTDKGYRLNFPLILIINLALTLLIGVALFGFGLAERVDRAAWRLIPHYEQLHHAPRLQRWLHPEEGFLAGRILSINMTQQNLELIDPRGNHWLVTLSSEKKPDPIPLEPDIFIGLRGEVIQPGQFQAEKIRILPALNADLMPPPPRMKEMMFNRRTN